MTTVLVNKLAYFVNPALLELGGSPLSSLSTGSANKTESLCALTLTQIIDAVLEDAPWACVSKRDSSLSAASGITSDEFTYVYSLPADFIRLIGEPLYSGSPIVTAYMPIRDRNIYGPYGTKYLETNFSAPDIFYVFKTSLEDDATDTYYGSYFDSCLKDQIVAMCRWKWAFQVTGSREERESQRGEYIAQRTLSRSQNNQALKTVSHNTGMLRYARQQGVR